MVLRAGENITKEMRLQAFTALLCQDGSYFDDEAHSTGRICTRLATDAFNVRFVSLEQTI